MVRVTCWVPNSSVAASNKETFFTKRIEALQFVIHGAEKFHDSHEHCIGGGVRTRARDSAHDGGSGPDLMIPKLSPARTDRSFIDRQRQ
jgi:hypothetical protein